MDNHKISSLAEAAIMGGLAMVFAFIPLDIGASFGIQLGVIPICLISIRRGVRIGVLASFIWGVLYLVTGKATILSPMQAFLEYFIAFGFCGLPGVVSEKVKRSAEMMDYRSMRRWIIVGTFIGVMSEYLIHFIAGVIYWGQYAPEGMNPVFFSAIANGISGVSSWICCFLILIIMVQSNPKLIKI